MAYLVIPMAAADATEDLGRKLIGRYSRLLDLQKRKEGEHGVVVGKG